MDMIALKNELGRDEGMRRRRYQDTKGIWTIGIGHNIEADDAYPYSLLDEPLTDSQIENLFWNDIQESISECDHHCPWWTQMSDARQRVLCNMMFNMGWTKLRTFVNTLRAMREGRYAQAASGMRASLWAKQVGDRAERLAKMMERG